jgi:hydroxyethylthiazole kinase-like uncharacterized protein yjeF
LRYYGEDSLKLVTAEQMRRIDRNTIGLGIPGIVLMENAALCVVRALHADFVDLSRLKVAIVCGTGNNGGDGFAVARHLVNAGSIVRMFLAGESSSLRGDARTNYEVILNMGISVIEVTDINVMPELKQVLGNSDVIVNALGLRHSTSTCFHGSRSHYTHCQKAVSILCYLSRSLCIYLEAVAKHPVSSVLLTCTSCCHV